MVFDHYRLEALLAVGAASLVAYVIWGPKATKSRSANAAGVLAGLQNVGNSCFLNAVLQALCSSPAVMRWLSRPAGGARPAHARLRAALLDVIHVVNRTHGELRADPFTPAGVLACLSSLGWLIHSEEQDTHEMFYVLISTLQEEPAAPPPLSADSLRAPGAEGATGRGGADDGAGAWSQGAGGRRRLPRRGLVLRWRHRRAPQPLSLPALLGQFSARETVHDVTCDACQQRGRFSKRTLVAKLPSALCLHLPRTTWEQSGQAAKRGDHVAFFETLNMFPYTYAASGQVNGGGRPSPTDTGRHRYRLTAVIVHSGYASSGHFVTYRRLTDPADNRWFYTSDTLVSQASRSEVFAAAAYMLFYERASSSDGAAARPALPLPVGAR
ncbi:ubiquitin carboxyl-terminal hydrolase 30 homolog [Pollicipes pollicipes]|uniref:ubiquitin carboxyl-terminal hydrolase 30 homolog n=1 Tax=Pollicipes pollicipes TaxID=41117 RepID=UPI001884DF03|nr:ubiquitin carboxyl-terminal hydrolase 30 homolog [Pollicipes pollicipes]